MSFAVPKRHPVVEMSLTLWGTGQNNVEVVLPDVLSGSIESLDPEMFNVLISGIFLSDYGRHVPDSLLHRSVFH